MLPLDHGAAVEHIIEQARSHWRITAYDVTPGPGQHDFVIDGSAPDVAGALAGALRGLADRYPDIDPDALKWTLEPVHRGEP